MLNITLFAGFLFFERAKVPPPYVPLTEDHERMVEYLKASTAEWIAVYPPQITGMNELFIFAIRGMRVLC